MTIRDKCLICGESISRHSRSAFHGVACLWKLHDLIIHYAEFRELLHNLGLNKYPITDNVTKSTLDSLNITKKESKK